MWHNTKYSIHAYYPLCYYRIMDQVSELIYLKSVKRKAKFLYNFCHSFYESKVSRSTTDKRKVIYEALSALDGMYSMYETLKIGMRLIDLFDNLKW